MEAFKKIYIRNYSHAIIVQTLNYSRVIHCTKDIPENTFWIRRASVEIVHDNIFTYKKLL